ncbi:MAG: hypothetical protein HQL03_03495 [Nitrospirae bacterium]|nr:hypothetical protein [Nitrospirota bacterium]
MHQRYDIVLKGLLKNVPVKFLKLLTGYEDGRFLDVQFPDIQLREPDLVIEVSDGLVFHIELQFTNDKGMPIRMLEYYTQILKHYKKEPEQIVLYVGDGALRMSDRIRRRRLRFDYDVRDMREFDCRQLLESDKPEDIVLSILCRTEDIDGTVTSILGKLSLLPARQRADYVTGLLYLTNLRKIYKKVKQEVENMPITVDLANCDMYKDGLLEGQRKGLLEGQRKGLLEG